MEQKAWIRKRNSEKIDIREKNDVTYLAFQALDEAGFVSHAFSTRHGGVSEGVYSTMNFSFTRNDDPEHVRENYRRMASVLGTNMEQMVLSYQTHTTNVRKVTMEDAGKGIVKERDYRDVDGLITNIPGITLVTFYADCVPLYFADPVHKAIGLSHSGWRGTVHRMGQATLEAMHREYGTDPADVIACIGPSICQDCFEVGPEVAAEFTESFGVQYQNELFYRKPNGKYQVDLWRANQIVLTEAGIPKEQIHTTDICTKCNPKHLFSHRIMGTERGNLAAFLAIRE